MTMKGAFALSRVGDRADEGDVDRNGDKDWARTWQTGCTQVMYRVTCLDLSHYKYKHSMFAREGEAARGGRDTERMEREGTHSRLAAPVLMLRPAGPLADLAKAMVDRGAGSLRLVYTSLPCCLSASLPASKCRCRNGRICATRLG